MTTPAGFTTRAATPEDAEDAAALMNAFDRAHLAEPDTVDADEVGGWWARMNLPTDSLLYHGEDGRLAGVATLHQREEGLLDLDAFTHPDYAGRGLGGAMIDWLEAESRRRGHTAARTSAIAADRAAAALIDARGYEPIRHFYRMSVELEHPPPEPEWPAGFTVSTFQPGEEAIVHAVLEEAFAEHWGHEPESLEEWQAKTFSRPWWDPTLVYLVREGDEVAAGAVNAIRFGSGWVGTLGTRKPWRGRGLGRALLLHAFGEFHRRGQTRVALAVDAGNETGATQLYESVGMQIAWQADIYEKRL